MWHVYKAYLDAHVQLTILPTLLVLEECTRNYSSNMVSA
jgi:hypothetical protein